MGSLQFVLWHLLNIPSEGVLIAAGPGRAARLSVGDTVRARATPQPWALDGLVLCRVALPQVGLPSSAGTPRAGASRRPPSQARLGPVLAPLGWGSPSGMAGGRTGPATRVDRVFLKAGGTAWWEEPALQSGGPGVPFPTAVCTPGSGQSRALFLLQ